MQEENKRLEDHAKRFEDNAKLLEDNNRKLQEEIAQLRLQLAAKADISSHSTTLQFSSTNTNLQGTQLTPENLHVSTTRP